MKIVEGFLKAKMITDRSLIKSEPDLPPSLKQKLIALFNSGDPQQVVGLIIEDVRAHGDTAVIKLTEQIDRINLVSLEVTRAEIASAYEKVSDDLIGALEMAAERIRSFHEAQKKQTCHETTLNGVGQIIRPLHRVGIYAPGGTAWYPSTVLMTAVPARVAGVTEIVLTTPPGPDGAIPPPTLVAADIAGIDRIFTIGGAQAIAALAYGTETVPRVDKICGPGNIFVMLAKKQVYGSVAIDGLQGPSEIIVIADSSANPDFCAADLLAQAEHDVMASPIMITTSLEFANKVNHQIDLQLFDLRRKKIAGESIEKGIIIVVKTIRQAIELANLYAPEHLELCIKGAASQVNNIRNAGCVFIGNRSAVVLGDYVAGPSHVLPTGGTARFSSPLTVTDFIKFINTVNISEQDLTELVETAVIIAENEGLEAHARAGRMRLRRKED